MYLHDGLDLMLPNGTKLFAVTSGYVRHIKREGVENQKWVFVEDADRPGTGWGYTHVDDFQVTVGQYVPQGTFLARVRFTSPADHVHLDRLHVPAGGSWSSFYSLVHSQPDTFFVYTDTEKPVFEGGFRYVAAETDNVIAIGGSPAGPPRVPSLQGAVDIVAGLRDPGAHSRQPGQLIADRLAITTLRYGIVDAAGDTVQRGVLDLRGAMIPRLGYQQEWRIARSIVAPYEIMAGAGARSWSQTKTTYYVVTNLPSPARTGWLTPDDAALSWNTAATDAAGRRRFPDGEYTVGVWAQDFKGNSAFRTEQVRVDNGSSGR
jgi:hypothetical protein